MILVFGHNSPNRRAVGELLYLGSDGDEAQKTIDENSHKFARIDRSLPGIEAHFRTVQQFDENHPALKAETPREESQSSEEMTPESKSKRSRK